MKIKQVLAAITVAAALSAFPQFVHAGKNNGKEVKQTKKVPFDGGLSLLVAAGIGIAIKKGYDNRRKQSGISIEN